MASIVTGKQNPEPEKRLRDEIEKRHGKSVEQLYRERETRIRDAIELREPDRVPVIMARNSGTHFVSSYTGVPLSAAYYDPVTWKVMIGGGQISNRVKDYVAADAFGMDAVAAVRLVKEWTG